MGSYELPHKFGPDRLNRFEVDWIQTNKQEKHINNKSE